jgi:nicotinate-nucleotide pyrophosphorylase (carboxylating)
MRLPQAAIEDRVRLALAEDLGEAGDVTSQLALPEPRRARARIVAKAAGVLAGVEVAAAAFRQCDPAAEVTLRRADGTVLQPGDEVLAVAGDAAAILAAERTALNFLQRLSGVATTTRRYVEALAGSGADLLETRKTTPGLRLLEKYAVAVGGGRLHRLGLHDQVLLKENHFAAAAPRTYEEVVRVAVEGAPERTPGRPVIAEARSAGEARAAVAGGAGVVLLDNFRPDAELRALIAGLREQAAALGQRLEIEVSGGVALDTIRDFAACGADRISVGALTHSVVALDLSLLMEVNG